MINSTMPTHSSFYRTTLFLALLIWPLSVQSQTIDYTKDGKVAAEACVSYLVTGKLPTLALEQAGFSGTSTRPIYYNKMEKNRSGPRITIYAGSSKKRGRSCFAEFNLRTIRTTRKSGYDWAGAHALNAAFQTALVAKGYKKTVIKIEKDRQKERELTRFVKGNLTYTFRSPNFYKSIADYKPFMVGFFAPSPLETRWWRGQ